MQRLDFDEKLNTIGGLIEIPNGRYCLAAEVEKLEAENKKLRADIISGVLKDHEKCGIYCDEIYTALEVKYNNLLVAIANHRIILDANDELIARLSIQNTWYGLSRRTG